jgi:predicted phosphodiesterase
MDTAGRFQLKSRTETAILVMTDLHYGRKTTSFNPEVCKERLKRLGATMERLREVLSGYDFDRLVVFLLGDVNDGTDIYATQPHHQAITNVEQQANELSGLLSEWLLGQIRIWGAVSVEAVPGNHGRSGRATHEAASWDVVTYRYLSLRLKNRVAVGMNTSSHDPFIRKVKIRNHYYVLYHGHDIRTFANIPFYGMMLRTSRWLSTQIAPFDVICMGHFHTLGTWKINRVRLILSGTMISDDDWALRSLGWESACEWWLFGCSNSRPITWQFPVDLAGG